MEIRLCVSGDYVSGENRRGKSDMCVCVCVSIRSDIWLEHADNCLVKKLTKSPNICIGGDVYN